MFKFLCMHMLYRHFQYRPRLSYAFVSLLLLTTTGTTSTRCKQRGQSKYYENLAVHRKKFKTSPSAIQPPRQSRKKHKHVHITPQYDITEQLDYLLECKKEIDCQQKYIPGYTVQCYKGSSREEALQISKRLYAAYPQIEPEVSYDVPNYTVRLGKFLDKLEAYFAYAAIKKHMPQAIIRPASFVNKPDTFNDIQNQPKELLSNTFASQ